MKKFRKDFVIFKNHFEKEKVVYFDSAATSLKPTSVIQAIRRFYEYETSNVSRGNHFLSEKNSFLFEQAREKVGSFLKAKPSEIAFTQNCTDAINQVAKGLVLNPDSEVIVSELEHHSNYLPWKQVCQTKSVRVDEKGRIDLNHLESLISDKTKLIAITYVSNVTGNIQPIAEISNLAKKNNILLLIDAAQAVGHFPIDVHELDCDFLAFSAHKMFGPSGVGVLYAHERTHGLLFPAKFGGNMVSKVMLEGQTYRSFPNGFEAGTPNIEGVIGLGAAIDYIEKIGFPVILKQLESLDAHLKQGLLCAKGIKIPFPINDEHIPIFSFQPQNTSLSSEQLGQVLSDSYKIITRAGYHCCQPLYLRNKTSSCVRVSLHIYNTMEDIDFFLATLSELKQILFCI